jgi:NAD/NADP transhydrogenase alpha subunit
MAPARRRRVALHSNAPDRLPLKTQLIQAATSPTARAVYIAVGAVGLAALGVAIFGPKRFNRQIVQPVRTAVGDQAERMWTESRGLRDQLAGVIDRVQSESGREKLVKSFQSWVGHFRAT